MVYLYISRSETEGLIMKKGDRFVWVNPVDQTVDNEVLVYLGKNRMSHYFALEGNGDELWVALEDNGELDWIKEAV